MEVTAILLIIFVVVMMLDLIFAIVEYRKRKSDAYERIEYPISTDILIKLDNISWNVKKLQSAIDSYCQQTCISGEEFDEKLEEVRKILVELEKRGNNNGQE